MRNYLKILDEINKLLADNKLENERQQLEFEVDSSFPASVLCLRSYLKLLTLQIESNQFDYAVENLIEELVSYCRFYRLYPKSNYEN
jgi:hypothetical protein